MPKRTGFQIAGDILEEAKRNRTPLKEIRRRLATESGLSHSEIPGNLSGSRTGSTWVITASDGKKWTGNFIGSQYWPDATKYPNINTIETHYWKTHSYTQENFKEFMLLVTGGVFEVYLQEYIPALVEARAHQKAINDVIMSENS